MIELCWSGEILIRKKDKLGAFLLEEFSGT